MLFGDIFGGDIKRRAGYKSRNSSSKKRAKEILDYLDNYWGRDYGGERHDYHSINWDLFNGRLDIDLYDDPISVRIGTEDVLINKETIVHYGFISQIARAMHGEQIVRPFNPVAKSVGPRAKTMRKAKTNELISQWLTASVVAPLKQRVFEQYAQQNGVQDVRQLTPEQQQQLQADVERRAQALTPPDIVDFMENSFTVPSQRAAQEMVNWIVQNTDCKHTFDDGFKAAIAVGEEYFYVGQRNQDVAIEWVNPRNFTCAGGSETVDVHRMDWGRWEQWDTVQGVLRRYAMEFRDADVRKIERMIEPLGGFRAGLTPGREGVASNRLQAATIIDHSDPNNPYRAELDKGGFNVNTREGHRRMMDLYAGVMQRHGNRYGTNMGGYGIRTVHCAYRENVPFKYVKRVNPNSGEIESYWMWEHYEPQPQDVEVSEVLLEQVFEGTKIGTYDEAVYVGMKPTLGQYKSVFDPTDVELPFYGRKFNTHRNNSKNVSPVDLGKPFQKEIDATLSQIRFDMSTSMGKVFLMNMAARPEGWTWQQTVDTMRSAKIVPVNMDQSGGPVDPQMARAIDMTFLDDIAGKLQYVQSQREYLIQAMLFNDARVGAVGQYATNTNTKVNQGASYNQTEEFFTAHRRIMEQVLNAAVSRAKSIYKDNPHRREQIFSDISLADLAVNEDFWYEDSNVHISLATEDIQNVQRIKDLALTLTQNALSPESIIELTLAKAPAEIMSIMRKASKTSSEQQQAAQEAQLQAQQAELQAKHQLEMEKLMAEQAHASEQAHLERLSKERRSLLEASQFERQADVDRNNVADSIERQKIASEVQQRDNDQKNAIRTKELELKEREVEVKEKMAKKPTSNK